MAEAKLETRTEIIDNRSYDRSPVRIAINYQWDGSIRMNRSANLSETGVYIHTDNPLPEGTELKMNFILPEILERIEVIGDVARSIKPGESPTPGMGVRFLNLGARQRALITELKSRFMR